VISLLHHQLPSSFPLGPMLLSYDVLNQRKCKGNTLNRNPKSPKIISSQIV
jgi:hypothetical protein